MTTPSLEPARGLLVRRIARYADAECEALLGVLDGLAALHERLDLAGRALAAGAFEPLTEAARQITFDASRSDVPLLHVKHGPVPSRPEPPTLPVLVAPRAALRGATGPDAAAGGALLDALEALQSDLIFAADMQEYVDARANAICYLRAAAQVALAADALAAVAARIAASAGDS